MALAAALAARKGKTVRRRKPRVIAPLGGLPPRNKKNAFTPFKAPAAPPPSTYDPALDAQLRASQRGLADTQADAATGGTRSLSDYLLARGNALRQRGEGLADLIRSRQNTKEDYLANVTGLNRRYDRLANTQAQAVRSTGNSSGVLAQALRKRTENRAIEQQPLDVNLGRANVASNIAQTRLTEGSDRQLGALGVQYQRGVQDRAQTVARAGREASFFGTDVAAERFYQAKATGYPAPTRPANEFTRHGLTYQANAKLPAARRTYTLPSGQRFNRQQWLRYLRTRRR